ncbi:hypothetical protein HNO88_002573 [Novosphingobium chloroacetimidivorans]|uniref:Rad50/SbcC-type AAA domain-containing protein n=1 Tax=Novosphingobium chloroacetimidivorans TaxID=1428314 RepID=A0A7W7KAH9_9SPHN|nr:hypothetical protein [Novosphingobium chloroacetimidivorans]MBB4859244.1 hypothetical protein [Novosphingobium chloroacetimidivorans]
MKSLKLRRLLLLSRHERKARQEKFDDSITVVRGENDTGKSHLIKSIYGAFGADASVVNEKWSKASVATMVEFSVDGAIHSILRFDDQFALFDAADDLLWTGNSLVNEVGPKVAELLDFTIQLTTKSAALVVPPPQFCFLPFYQDQDRGWDDSWSSFRSLAMIPHFKKSILEYHTGIRPREYYSAQAQRADAQREQNELKAERRALDRATARLRNGRSPVTVTFSPELFGNQIEQLLAELNELRAIFEGVKHRISELQSRRAVLVEEIEIAQVALTELDADVKFTQNLADSQVVCPTCSTVHENDFANRFSLISDADACRGFLAKARYSLAEVEADVARQLQTLQAYNDRIGRIDALLAEKRGEVKLRDMLQDESERIVDATIAAERAVIDGGIVEWQIKEDEAFKLMKAHSSAKRKAEIVAFYAKKLSTFATDLGVTFETAVKKSISPKINETGSYGPRAILAYHFALLHTIREFTTSCLCPVILDTPLQQDQDETNAAAIIAFALKNRPRDMQLVLGTVSLHGAEYNGHVINPQVKESLLREDEFETINSYMRPFINKLLGHDQGELL